MVIRASFPPRSVAVFPSDLAGCFPSIIQTRRGKATTMEDHTKALADLTAAISALTTKIDEIHPMVLELQGWKPTIEQSVEELRVEVGDLRSHVAQAAPGKAPGTLDVEAPRRKAPPVRLADLPPLLPLAASASRQTADMESARNGGPLIRLMDLPPLLPLTAAAPRQVAGEPLSARGDDRQGHGFTTLHRGKSPGRGGGCYEERRSVGS